MVAKLGPVSVTTPAFVTPDAAIIAGSTAGGMLAADYVVSSAIARTAWTGTTVVAAGALGKTAIAGLSYFGATKTEGMPEKALYFGAAGALASVALDLYRWVRPMVPAGEATSRLARPVRLALPPVRVPVPAARAETPSGESLGGF